MRLGLNWKVSTYWLVFVMLEDLCRHLGVNYFNIAMNFQWYTIKMSSKIDYSCNSGMTVLSVANCFVIAFKAHSSERNYWLILNT